MDHHHHHPPQPHHHLHAQPSRYAPLPPRPPPPVPVFLDPDPYRRQPHLSFPVPPPPAPPAPRPPPATAQHHHHHHHHPTDDGGIVFVSYASSSSHASAHGRFLVPADPPGRLVFKPPHPPVPAALRVSDRIIFPEGHPEAPRMHPHGRRSVASGVFVREDVKRERVVRVFDDGQQLGLPYGRREAAVAVELGEQEDLARRVALLGRKRPRWEEDRVVLAEGTLIERFEGREPRKRVSSSGASTSRRCEVVYDPRVGVAEHCRGSTSMFSSERGEAAVAFPRLPPEAPVRSSGHSVSKLELLENSKMLESENLLLGSSLGFREKHFTSRARRNIFVGEEDVRALPKKALQQKPSVLSRIQFAKPVRQRKHEQQIMLSASPLPIPQSSAFSGCDQLEMGGPVELDVSFKSDVLVAKEILTSPGPAVSRSIQEVFGAKTAKKNVAKDTSIYPSTSFPRPGSKVTAKRTHKVRSSEEMFAQYNPDKGRTPKKKVATKSLVSSKNVLQNFDSKVTGSRTPRNKVASEVMILSNPVQHSPNRVSPVTITEKKMAVEIVAPADDSVQNDDGKVTFTRSSKRKPSKEVLVPQINAMPNPNDGVPTLKNLKNLSSDGMIATETCLEDNLAGKVLNNCTGPGPNFNAADNSTGSTGKLEKETLVTQASASLPCNEKVAILKDPNREVLQEISFPSVLNAEVNDITERPEKKPGNNPFTPSSSAVNSDKKITVMQTLNKKVVKRSKKKKVIASIAPCLPSMDPPGEFCKGHEPTNSSPKGTDSSKDIKLGVISTASVMKQKTPEEGKKDTKLSETVQKVLTLDSSTKVLKHLEDVHARFVSRYPEGMASTAVRSIKKKVIRRRNSGVVTLIPCTLESCPTQEICKKLLLNSSENKMHSKEVQLGSLSNCSGKDFNCSEGAHSDESHKRESSSNCFQEDLNFSEGAHKNAFQNKVLQDRLNAADVDSASVLTSSCEHVEHLENVYDGSTQTSACMGADFQGKGQQQHILSGCLNDLTYSVLVGGAEISDKLGSDSSTLEFDSQGIVSLGHLETNTTEVPSTAVVPREVDINGSSNEKNSAESAVENFRSSVLDEDSRAEGDVNFREGSGCGKHLSALKEISLSDMSSEKVQDEVVAFFDRDSSPKADINISKKEGEQKVTPRSQASSVVEKCEVVHNEKCAAIVLDCQMQERSIPLQVEAQTCIPESEKDIKQKKLLAQEVIMTVEKLGKLSSEDNIVRRERSRELQPDIFALPIEAQGAVLDHSYLMITNGEEDNILQSPFVDIFPGSDLSLIEAECPIVNSMTKQVSDRVHSSLRESEKNSAEDLATASEEMHLAEVKQPVSDQLDNKSCHDQNIVGTMYEDEDSKSKNDSLFDSVSEAKISGKSELTNLLDFLVSEKALAEPTQEAEKLLNRSRQVTCKEQLTGTKVCQKAGTSKIHPSQTSLSTRSFKKPPSHSIRRNTWHRTESPSLSLSSGHMKWPNGGSLSRQSPKKLGKFQSSYIRKGNSLIRKPSSVIPSVYPCPEQTALDLPNGSQSNKNMIIDDKIDGAICLSFSNAKTLSSSFERPKTPPLLVSNKSTQSAHPSLNGCQTLIEDPFSGRVGGDHVIPSVETPCSHLNEENHSMNYKVADKKNVVYVKHRSNQLVAAPGTDTNNSVHGREESKVLASAPRDLYYRNKNKLIRDTSSLDGHFKQEGSLPNGISDASCCQSFKMASLKGGDKVPRKTRLERAVEKTCKQSRFSLVWTLNGAHLQNNQGSNVLKHQKVLPCLFPWKRTTWRSVFTKMGSNSNRHGSSLIRKLQLSRQRGAIYTISNSGFSLRKSGLLGIGGSNLKWSKSMERRSKKASEEATLAVAEQEMKKSKQKGVSHLTTKRGNPSQHKFPLGIQLHQGERVFRVGTIYYKMDSSRRTLVRISDEKTPAVINSESAFDAKRSVVPRRLLIGNDEYIRVGNGNQLVRDPKKLVRILANEKIRWSLHTARLRSVRKQQYCQFFTRFGKCNKEDGKCPYIHDPTKVAICTKFLKGLCSSPSCRLTHKVIPERMPDCSYFLQGLCTNTTCPYRHVNVNPKACVCEGFLKGYCRDGDECQKKHSYVCPHFEASGKCLQGSACKLHHPKRASKQANKLRKRKRSLSHDHGRGRYFGCSVNEVSKPQIFVSNMDRQRKDEDAFFHEGRFAAFISLDVNDDDDVVEANDPLLYSHPISTDPDLSDSLSSDADALIKPIRIMNMDPR